MLLFHKFTAQHYRTQPGRRDGPNDVLTAKKKTAVLSTGTLLVPSRTGPPTMRTEGIVVSSPGAPFKYTTHLAIDSPLRPDEVHVRIKATGICHTDLIFSREHKMADMFPVVMGHEGAGVVSALGADVPARSGLAVGDRVIVVYSCCGECAYCERRETGYCDLWFQYNFGVGRADDASRVYWDTKKGTRVCGHFFGQSSFARDVFVKWTGLVKVDERRFGDVPFERLAALACGVMTGAGGMLNVVRPRAGTDVCVVGTGSVGLSAIMAVGLADHTAPEGDGGGEEGGGGHPKRIIAVDVVPARLEQARACGATHGVNSRAHPNLMETLLDITDGKGVDGAIDTTGRADVVQNLVHSCARKGKVVTIGTGGTQSEVTLNLFEMVQAGCSYVGCQQGNCYPQEFLPMLLQANKEGKFPYERLIKTYPVRDVQKAMEDMESGKVIKPVLLWD